MSPQNTTRGDYLDLSQGSLTFVHKYLDIPSDPVYYRRTWRGHMAEDLIDQHDLLSHTSLAPQGLKTYRLLGTLFGVLAVGLLAVNVLLLQRVRFLEKVRMADLGPSVGELLPALHGADQTGRPITIDYGRDQRETLILIFSTKCAICAINWPRWQRLTSLIDPRRYRLVYANMAAGLNADYLTAHGLGGATVLAKVDPRSSDEYKLNATPTTMLVGPDAKIENVWIGGLQDTDVATINKAFGISLAWSN